MTDSHTDAVTQPATTEQPERLDLRSHDIVADRQAEIIRLFPEVRTEGGKIDLDRLRRVLGETVDPGKERYGMNWPGKADCFKAIQVPSLGTLLPCPEESVEFDKAQNVIIEGDNLEVLKLLQKAYLGKIKMIYIDPPYNTGNDFIYPDNYSETLQTYLEYTGQVDSEGRKFSTNSEADGRFHSKWINMLYPRLYLARNLLREDGVIFISIDDKEMHNLRRICDEVFGEENRIGVICWKNVTDNNPTLITPDNEFIVCYAKSKVAQPKAWTSRFSAAKDLLQSEYERLRGEGLSDEIIQERIREFISDNEESVGFLSRYKHVDAKGVYTGSESVHNPRAGGYDFEVLHPVTNKSMRKPANGYRFPEATFREMEKDGIILYGEDEQRIVKIKKYLQDYEDSLRSVITLDGRLGSYELKRLFPNQDSIFTNPKPSELIESLVSFACGGDKDAIILDFFAGSGSTGHAVVALNKKADGKQRFILVQLPEPCESDSPAFKAGLKNIAEITRERLRRVISSRQETSNSSQGQLTGTVPSEQVGFCAFKLAESNFRTWNAEGTTDTTALSQQLDLHVNHIRQGRSDNDILYELLLKSGFALTTTVKPLVMVGKTVFSISDGAMLICLEKELTLELIKAIADNKPERVVLLDEGFAGNDQLKANAVQIMKGKGVTSFRTV